MGSTDDDTVFIFLKLTLIFLKSRAVAFSLQNKHWLYINSNLDLTFLSFVN